MNTDQLKHMALQFLSEFEHPDPERIAPMLADNFEYRVMTSMPFQTAFDRNQPLTVFIPMLQQMVPRGFNFKIVSAAAEGSEVAVQAESDTTLANGQKYANRYHFYFRFEGDQLTEVLEYCDTNHLRQAFSPEQ